MNIKDVFARGGEKEEFVEFRERDKDQFGAPWELLHRNHVLEDAELTSWMQKHKVRFPFCAAEMEAPTCDGDLFTLLLDDAALKECRGDVNTFAAKVAALRRPS